MLTDHQRSPVTFILGQFPKRCLNHQSLYQFKNDMSKISFEFPRGQWVKWVAATQLKDIGPSDDCLGNMPHCMKITILKLDINDEKSNLMYPLCSSWHEWIHCRDWVQTFDDHPTSGGDARRNHDGPLLRILPSLCQAFTQGRFLLVNVVPFLDSLLTHWRKEIYSKNTNINLSENDSKVRNLCDQ